MITKSEKAINFGAALMAAVVVICMAVTITVLARPLYYFDIEHLNIAQTSGYSAEACKLNYDVLIDYNLLGGEDELVFPTLRMSEEGRIHFEEVKDIFIAMQVVSLAGLAGYLGFAIWFIKHLRNGQKSEEQDARLILSDDCNAIALKYKTAKKGGNAVEKYVLWMKYTGYVCLLTAGIVCAAMLIDWQWAFTMMHNIFFDNDYWIFNPYTDPVIKILPDEFFFHCGIMIILLVILQIAGLKLVYNKLLTRV